MNKDTWPDIVNRKCIVCLDSMPNCLECTSDKNCSKCDNGKYVSKDQTSCIDACDATDLS